jgi:hypothetical protein
VAGGDGQDQGVTLAVVEAYDPSTNSWNSRASMPLAHFWPGFGVVGDRLYVIGGTNNDGRLGIVNSYDPVTDSWSVGPSVPKGDVTAAVVDGVIYAVVNGYAFAYRP